MTAKIKLSEKQKEVLALLRQGNYIHWIGGLHPMAFMSSDNNYTISTATVLRLHDLGIVEMKEKKALSSEYTITALGKTCDIK